MFNPTTSRRTWLTRIGLGTATSILVCWYAQSIADDHQYWVAGIVSLATFGLWWGRRSRNSGELSPGNRGRVIVSAILMVAAVLAGPWIGLMGAVVLLHGMLRSQQDGDRGCSLGYLALIPIVCIRLPTWLTERISHRFELETVRIASLLLDQTGVLHDRNETQLFSAAGEVSVADVTSQFISPIVFMALAAVFLCIRRRRFLQAVPALAIAGVCSIMMTTSALCFRVALPPSAEFLIRCLPVLSFVAFFIVFAIAEVGFSVLTRSIPTVLQGILKGQTKANPCVVLWNNITLPRTIDGVQERQKLPDLGPLIKTRKHRIRRHLKWFLRCFVAWLASRQWRSLVLNPALYFVVFAIGYGCLKTPENLSAEYQAAVENAMKNQQAATSGFILNRLAREGTSDLSFRHEFAMQVISGGHVAIARPYVQQLTPFNSAGYAPTRKWLVRQSKKPDAILPLSSVQRAKHLNTGLRFDPHDVDFLELLAQELIDAGQFSLAEPLLEKAANIEPVLTEALVRLKRQRGRDPEEIRQSTQENVKRLEQQVELQRSQPVLHRNDAAIALARIYIEQGRDTAAETLLRSQPNALQSATIRQLLSTLLTSSGVRLLKTRHSYAKAQPSFVNAIELNPANVQAADSLYEISRVEGSVTSAEVSAAIRTLRTRVGDGKNASEDSLALANLLAADGQTKEAVERLSRMIDRPPMATVKLIRLLHQTGNVDQASQLVKQLRQNVGPVSDSDYAWSSVWIIAEAYAATHRPDDVISFMESELGTEPSSWPEHMRRLYQQSLEARFDAGKKPSGTRDTVTDFETLQQSISLNPKNRQRLYRIVELSQKATAEGQAAKSFLTARLADPAHMQETRTVMGYAALVREDYVEALKLLKRCVQVDPADATLLNNLAFAYLKTSTKNASEALVWANKALAFAPEHPDFLSTRAEILIALEDWQEAEKDINAVLSIDPNREDALTMKAKFESWRRSGSTQ